MDTQDIFDRIVERSKNQVQSMDDQGDCFYRDPEGKKPPCFVGVLIKDEFYNPKMEGLAITDLWYLKVKSEYSLRDALVQSIERDPTTAEAELLIDCQFVHDNHDPDKWEYELKVIAQEYNLEYK